MKTSTDLSILRLLTKDGTREHHMNMKHFESLRTKINQRLEEIGTRHAHRQIREFPWLYGALGQVPSDVMFVCENPSLGGVEKADARTISGGVPSIEDQWAGGIRSNCIKRFRPILCQLGLKTTEPSRPEGWRCYISNVIKEADVVRDFNARDKEMIAGEWADVLNWEIREVSPSILFTVGGSTTKLIRSLQRRQLIPPIPTHSVIHYSAYQSDDEVKGRMLAEISAGLGRTH